jgi:hypothetical protein
MGIGMEGPLSRKASSSEHRASELKWGKRRVSERGRRSGRVALYPGRRLLVFELHLLKQSGT